VEDPIVGRFENPLEQVSVVQVVFDEQHIEHGHSSCEIINAAEIVN
jgi:hypothetical protein